MKGKSLLPKAHLQNYGAKTKKKKTRESMGERKRYFPARKKPKSLHYANPPAVQTHCQTLSPKFRASIIKSRNTHPGLRETRSALIFSVNLSSMTWLCARETGRKSTSVSIWHKNCEGFFFFFFFYSQQQSICFLNHPPESHFSLQFQLHVGSL